MPTKSPSRTLGIRATALDFARATRAAKKAGLTRNALIVSAMRALSADILDERH
jgi:hypothetical protein